MGDMPEPTSGPPQEAPRRLLVIDDELSFAEMVSKAGAAIGYAVEITTRAAEFKAAFLRIRPDTICLDVFMPDMDGIQLIQWLIEQDCKSKVVIVTGYNPLYAKITKQLAMARGHFETVALTKPMFLADLQEALR